jgi:glycosyltransferase involved in cell wall biosynthesis
MRAHISIAMAVYNGERFLPEQLDSLLRQTRLPDEMVVSDDASTDSTVKIVSEFAARAPFPVRILVNDQNVGCTKNFERAIRECAGEIIFLCDCDDVWYPEKVRLTVATLASHPKAGLATCDADLIDENARLLGRRFWESFGFASGPRGRDLSEGNFFSRSVPTYGPGIAFRARFKPLVLPLPGSDPFRWGGQDVFTMWCIVGGGAGGIALIDQPLLAYRRHPSQLTSRGMEVRFARWKARTQRPLAVLAPLIERLESDVARSLCVNPKMREAALRHWRSRVFKA